MLANKSKLRLGRTMEELGKVIKSKEMSLEMKVNIIYTLVSTITMYSC